MIQVWKILLFESISGLPFASIPSLPPLKTSETTPNEELTSPAYVTNLINTENSVSASSIPETSPSNVCQLFIGLPIGNTNYFLNQNLSLVESSNGVPSPDKICINLPASINIQTNSITLKPASDPSSSVIDLNLDSSVGPSVTCTSVSNNGLKSDNLKRGSRDTISQEQSVIQQNLGRLTSNCASNFPSPVFPSIPPSTKPMFPCIEKSVDVTRPIFNFVSPSVETGELSNAIESDCSLSSPFQSQILTNINPNLSFQNNLICPQDNRNMLLAQNLLNKNIVQQNRGEIDSDTQSNTSFDNSEIITLTPLSTPVNNALSSFAEIKNLQNLQFDRIQNQPIMPNSHINRLNNNLMNAKISQSNNIASQISESNGNCEYINQNIDLNSEYENVLRIRNSVIPRMISNNGPVKSIPRNIPKNNNDENQGCPQVEAITVQDSSPFTQNNIPKNNNYNNRGCPQIGTIKVPDNRPITQNIIPKYNNDNNRGCPQVETMTVPDNRPFTQNNNFVLNFNDYQSDSNNKNVGNIGSIPFNNLARVIKHEMNDNKYYGPNIQNNNNQGCPLLSSIPVCNKESLLNKQLCEINNIDLKPSLQNNFVNINKNNLININQNVQGCPQLLSKAQSNLYAMKNDEACTVCNNRDCNCIQTPIPNDNLAQALKMVNRAKIADVPASTINILPFGEALLDGKPMSNDLIKVEPVSCPEQLPTCKCSDSSNSKKFLTIQDVSSRTFPTSPLKQSCSNPSVASVPVQANIMVSSPFNPIQTTPPITSNKSPSLINLAPSVPTIPSITNTELPVTNAPLIISQEPSSNSNVQPMLTLLSTPNGINPIVTPNFIPVQSLPQVTFVNNPPTSMSVTPPFSLPYNCISSISNLPSVCNSLQSIQSYPLITKSLQQTNDLISTSLFPSLNNMVTSLTQNIISTLMSKAPTTGTPLASLPPVNPFTSKCITETSSLNSPLCLDISEPSNYIVSTPLSSTGLSLPNIPVACNEYLPPIYSSPIIPMTLNTDLFCVESDSAFDCGPFALSTTDAYYPEISFMTPSCSSSDCSCLCGPLFMPASYLPQSPSVIKINNTGREAKDFEQLLKNIVI